MFTGLAEGTGLGLATGISCLASCGPIYLTYLLSEKRTPKESFLTVVMLNLGRFVSYAAFGAIMGLIGGSIPNSVRIPLTFSGYILFSVYLIVSVVRVNKTCSGCNIPKWAKLTKSPILLGILTGFTVCPAFLIALTSAFAASGALNGAMLFTGFFLGTTVYMLPFAIIGLFSKKRWLNSIAKYAAIFVAVYFGIMGIRGMASHIFQSGDVIIDVHEETQTEHTGPPNIYNALNEDSLYILTFPEMDGDRGVDMFSDLQGAEGPEMVLVQASENDWETVLESIPELAGVIAPWWMDFRSEAELTPWQVHANVLSEERRFRLFAIEYEPYDTERAGIVYQYLARYSFRCDPDSGFTFLLTSETGCTTSADCNTCPAYQDN
ncbi:MAG: sulfite exporter TauE/SafE family protein [Candidatus Sabulitectum sp.]|nr:sulfite exporter TauE/SafE family protein [Candidatus Sabulitectum sp.]